jgi:hypothetical protein|tara:strand:+ start:106 stop:276 length:171 start_codon:yes stop_codon:yes gene_type:complete
MLELIGFIAIGYIIFKMAPAILEGAFKFAVVCIGFLAFLLVFFYFVGYFWPDGFYV